MIMKDCRKPIQPKNVDEYNVYDEYNSVYALKMKAHQIFLEKIYNFLSIKNLNFF